MTPLLSWTATLLISGSAVFFLTAAVGLLRFPDVFTRLHAVAKADFIGLLLLVAGLALLAESWRTIVQLVLVLVLVMAASAATSTLIARAARRAAPQ